MAAAFGETPDPRLREVMTSLVHHLHAFVKDVELTEAEWAAAIGFLTRTGQTCDDVRQEFILLSDVLGVSMLVETINHRAGGRAPSPRSSGRSTRWRRRRAHWATTSRSTARARPAGSKVG